MGIDLNVPFLAKVRKVTVDAKNGVTSLKLQFVYYASEVIFDEIKDITVEIGDDHPLRDKILKLRSGDEVRAIPATNEITKVIPHGAIVRFLLRNNGI